MKILHVTPSFYPAHFYGGPTASVFALCQSLLRLGHEVRVLTTNANGPSVVNGGGEELLEGIPVRYCVRWLQPDLAPALLSSLPGLVRWADVVHITGVFSYSTPPALLSALMLERPVVLSPRGSLQRWGMKRRELLKRAWLSALMSAAPNRLALHVTAEDERADAADALPGVPLCLISNGVDVPETVSRPKRSSQLRLMTLGRLHPVKGIENLIAALPALPDATLAIVGDGDAEYVRGLQGEVDRMGLRNRVQFLGRMQDEDKERAFAAADLLVMPSHSENFGMAVAEALAHGVPVIASRNTPWSRVEDMGCGLWVDNDALSLADAIGRISRAPLDEMGARGREWMLSEFGWHAKALEMAALYGELLGPPRRAYRPSDAAA